MTGRPRYDLDKYKDLLIDLYRKKTPWPKIEQILLTEHGCEARAKSIRNRFKDWNVASHWARTDISDPNLSAKIKAYWADRGSRPKNDAELLQKLTADGFTVTRRGLAAIRKEMGLFRRWDERLGRWRPDSELPVGRRKRRQQKNSVFTSAQLAPIPDQSDGDQAQADESEYVPLAPTPDDEESGHYASDDTEEREAHLDSVTQPQIESEPLPQPPSPPIPASVSPGPATNHVPKRRGRPRKQPPHDQPTEQEAEPVQTTRRPRQVNQQPLTILYAKKNA